MTISGDVIGEIENFKYLYKLFVQNGRSFGMDVDYRI
jgi:hypothetical protein